MDQSPPRWPHVMKDLSEDRGANTVTIGAAGPEGFNTGVPGSAIQPVFSFVRRVCVDVPIVRASKLNSPCNQHPETKHTKPSQLPEAPWWGSWLATVPWGGRRPDNQAHEIIFQNGCCSQGTYVGSLGSSCPGLRRAGGGGDETGERWRGPGGGRRRDAAVPMTVPQACLRVGLASAQGPAAVSWARETWAGGRVDAR